MKTATSGNTDETAHDHDDGIIPPPVLRALREAVRFSAAIDGAPARCPRRDCRRLGGCQTALDPFGDPDCLAGLGPRTLDRAVAMVVFLVIHGRKVWGE